MQRRTSKIAAVGLAGCLVLGVACTRSESTLRQAKPAPQPFGLLDAGAPTLITQAVLAPAAPAPSGDGSRVASGGGARVTVPAGAVEATRAISVARVPKEELERWPRGTGVGFTFAPAELRFAVPITIELPHEEPEGEVMCEDADGARSTEAFAHLGDAPVRLHVMELPVRCAIYTAEHTRARQASKAQAEAVVAKLNASFKWDIKGTACDPRELVRPNAGKDLREPAGTGGCPAGMTRIPNKTACIDRWEAHVVEILDDGSERTWSPYFNPAGIRLRAKSAPGAVPQGYISQPQAAEACKAANKRLCTDDEWQTACRGSRATPFPYGAEEKRGTCNDHRDTHPAAQYLARTDTSIFSKLEHPCLNQLPDSLMTTGAKADCHTPDDAFDMVGNLHEWTADPAGTFRGGYYVETQSNGRGCDYATTAHEASYWDYSTGFRCCADTTP